jgi:hypothetical protein
MQTHAGGFQHNILKKPASDSYLCKKILKPKWNHLRYVQALSHAVSLTIAPTYP